MESDPPVGTQHYHLFGPYVIASILNILDLQKWYFHVVQPHISQWLSG